MPTRGPQSGPIIFTYTGIDAIIKKLNALDTELTDPNMSGVVRGAAKVWDKNYKSEGGSVGNWAALSEYTKAIRIWRGYTEEHPIMVQSGGLYKAAVDFPLHFTQGAGSITTAPGRMNDATPTTTTIYTTRSRVILTISGSKVANQNGGSDIGTSYAGFSAAHRIPPRRFWFVNDEVRTEMQTAFLEGLRSWKALSG